MDKKKNIPKGLFAFRAINVILYLLLIAIVILLFMFL